MKNLGCVFRVLIIALLIGTQSDLYANEINLKADVTQGGHHYYAVLGLNMVLELSLLKSFLNSQQLTLQASHLEEVLKHLRQHVNSDDASDTFAVDGSLVARRTTLAKDLAWMAHLLNQVEQSLDADTRQRLTVEGPLHFTEDLASFKFAAEKS